MNESLFKGSWSHDQDGQFSSPEPKGWLPWNLVCSIGCSSTSQFVQLMTLGWPWPILQQAQIWPLMLLYGKKVKLWFFKNYCRLWFETSNRWLKWQVSVDIKTWSLGGCMLPAPGLYTCIKSWKKLYKIDFKDIFLNLQQMTEVTLKLCPLGAVCPCPRAILV